MVQFLIISECEFSMDKLKSLEVAPGGLSSGGSRSTGGLKRGRRLEGPREPPEYEKFS